MKINPPMKAVVVDDDPDVLFLMTRILQRRGYDVVTYNDPAQSPLHQCKTCPCSMHDSRCPDLMIVDYKMPVVNGAELLESHAKKGCRCRYLALMSGAGIPHLDLKRLAKYGTRYFSKPLDFNYFYAWIDCVEQDIADTRNMLSC